MKTTFTFSHKSTWADLESFCRWLAPIDFNDRRLYVRTPDRLPASLGPHGSFGYTTRHLAHVIKPYVAEWRGPGAACVVDPLAIRQWAAKNAKGDRRRGLIRTMLFATVVHEFGHCLDDLSQQAAEISPELVESESQRIAEWCKLPGDQRKSDTIVNDAEWFGHDAQFLRIVLHLMHRADQLGVKLPLSFAYGTEYGLNALAYGELLGDEPEAMIGESFSTILSTTPPAAYVERWRSDLREWFLGIVEPTDRQTELFTSHVHLFSD